MPNKRTRDLVTKNLAAAWLLVLVSGVASGCSLASPTQAGNLTSTSLPTLQTKDLRVVNTLRPDLTVTQALIVENTAYLSTYDPLHPADDQSAVLIALDLETNNVIWRLEAMPVTSMRTDGRALYAFKDQNDLIAISRVDGSIIWSKLSATNERARAFVIGDSQLFMVTDDLTNTVPPFQEIIASIDAKSGTVRWSHTLNLTLDNFSPVGYQIGAAGDYDPISYNNNSLYLRVHDDTGWYILSLNGDDGSTNWKFPFTQAAIPGEAVATTSHLVFGDSKAILGAYIGQTFAIDQVSGQKIWTNPQQLDHPIFEGALLLGDMLYEGSPHLVALEAKTGTIAWTAKLDDYIDTTSPFEEYEGALAAYSWDVNNSYVSLVEIVSGKKLAVLKLGQGSNCLFSTLAFASYKDSLYHISPNCIYIFQYK